jgi:hypothetical protein
MKKSRLDRSIEEIESGRTVKFLELLKICEDYFGNYRVSGSHHIFKTPWQGDPRINLQKGKGSLAKPYQVWQVLNALRKLKEFEEDKQNEQDD